MALPTVQTQTVLLGGGLDLESPQLAIKAGFAIEAVNIEPKLMGGYGRISGYERIDGKLSPAQAEYDLLEVDKTDGLTKGALITGSISTASQEIVGVDHTINAVGVMRPIAGGTRFVKNDVIGTAGAKVTASIEFEQHPDKEIDRYWTLAAHDVRRKLITRLRGTGPVLGCCRFRGVYYGWRKSASGDGDVIMQKSTATGWQPVPLYKLLSFNLGTYEEGTVAAGDAITGKSSFAQATIKKIVKTAGNYGTDAQGYVIIDGTTTFTKGETILKGEENIFTSAAASIPIVFKAGNNRFKVHSYNFGGNSGSRKLYGCDGVNRAFEFDGDVLTPIITGMADDSPHVIAPHKQHLFLGFAGGSLQHSSSSKPLIFDAVTGAAELGMGYDIKSIASISEVLFITTSSNISALYGSSVKDWQIKQVAAGTGDIADGTLQVIGSPILVSPRGIVRVDASQVFGNFESSTVSRRINPLLAEWLATKTIVGTSTVLAKNQYRVYFSDGCGIILAHDSLFGSGQLPQFTTFKYPNGPSVVAAEIDPVEQDLAGGEGFGTGEHVLFGSADGYVYRSEVGDTFDGRVIDYSLRLPYHSLGSPSVRKAFKRLRVGIGKGSATLQLRYSFSDGQEHTEPGEVEAYSLSAGHHARWGEVKWGRFRWSEPVRETPHSMSGTGTNVSLFFYADTSLDTAFTITSVTYQFIPRRLDRG